MRYEELGNTGIKISKIGLGTWQFGTSYWGWGKELDEKKAIEIVRTSLELGINFIDTAELYGWGKSEQIVGKAIKLFDREELVVATKVFPTKLTVRGVIKALERSLKRLNTSYIDLYQTHWPSPVFPLKRALRALERKLEEGRIRAIGVSNFSLEQLKEARSCLAKQDIASNQVEYSLFRRDIERDLLPYCQKEGITIIAYSPLAQGLLTGKYGPGRMPRGLQRRFMIWVSYRKINWSIVDELRKMAEARNATPAQVALSWVIRHKGVVAIPGAKDVRHVKENVAALDIALKEEELTRLDAKSRLKIGF